MEVMLAAVFVVKLTAEPDKTSDSIYSPILPAAASSLVAVPARDVISVFTPEDAKPIEVFKVAPDSTTKLVPLPMITPLSVGVKPAISTTWGSFEVAIPLKLYNGILFKLRYTNRA